MNFNFPIDGPATVEIGGKEYPYCPGGLVKDDSGNVYAFGPDGARIVGQAVPPAEGYGTPVDVTLSQPSPCPDCQGTGQYAGLTSVEPCRTCGGRGVQ